MAVFVLLQSTEKKNYGLYQDGELVANFSHNDYREYIDDQLSKRMGEDDDLIERDHVGSFPDTLPNKGVKQERLKSNGNKKPSQMKVQAEDGKVSGVAEVVKAK